MVPKEHYKEKQLPLSIGVQDECSLETYYAGGNLQVVEHLKQLAQGQGEFFVYLWGRKGVGRSHLLQGACHYANHCHRTAFYLDLANPIRLSSLEGLEQLNLICIDGIEIIAGNREWEEGLFYLFNRIRAAGHQLLVASRYPPNALPLKLLDLQSRLTWGVTYQLQPLDDEALLGALQLRAKKRGLELSNEVGNFLIRRCVRKMSDLYSLLDKLDKASLAAQRRLTIPFIKSVLLL